MANLEMHTQPLTRKRGGAKCSGIHLGLLALSTILLTLAAVLLIMQINIAGVLAMVLGILTRVIDTRVS